MHSALQGAAFHVDHIVPKSKNGTDELENLELLCISCNLSKSDRTEVIDPTTGELVAFFNPRDHPWREHFRLDIEVLIGLTSIGRATITALDLNSTRRQLIRKAESQFGLFPPDDVAS